MNHAPEPGRAEPRMTGASDGRSSQHALGSHLNNERRDERLHVRVKLPFDVNLPGKRLRGHDISVSGLSTTELPPLEVGQSAECEIDIHCNGFRAVIPATIQMLGTRANAGGRFEIVQIGHHESSILRRLIRAHLAGVHLTLDQLAAAEDPQTVRDRVTKSVKPPTPAPSLVRFGATLTIIAVLYLVLGAALYEHLFVIEPDFAAVTAPEIVIHAPTDGVLAPHDLDPSDAVQRDEILAQVQDPGLSAELTLAEATLKYNERLLENLREDIAKGRGGATVVSAGPGSNGAPVLTKLNPLEARARVSELETNYTFAKAKLRALQARDAAGTIYAPCDCIVYSMRSGVGGYWVQKGAQIARLIAKGDKNVMVEALVHLNTIRGIEPNERAEVIMPTTGETRIARVTSVQLEGQKVERAGFPEWARQDMSHGTVVLAMEEPLPSSLVGHPVEVRFIDTDSAAGEAIAGIFRTIRDLLSTVTYRISNVLDGRDGAATERS